MQSDDPESTDTHSLTTDTMAKEAAKTAPTPLRREAVFLSTERNRSALVAACCSLAGVGLGFGLSQMASIKAPCAHHVSVSHVRSHLPAPTRALTWLGVEVQSSRHAQPGAHVTQVMAGSPAELVGLDVGDVIVGLGDATITSSEDLVRAVRAQAIGSRLVLTTVNHEGDKQQTLVELGGIGPHELRQLRR